MQRRGASRTLPLALLALAMIGAGVALVVFRNTPNTGPAAPTDPNAPSGRMVEELLAGQEDSGTGMVIQITDEDDPTRLSAEILAERYDPDGPTIRLVEKPRAWLFGDDNAAWLIEADRGRFYIPEGESSPREGTLTGNVIARRYEPDPANPTDPVYDRPDPETDRPALTATTDEPLRFNLDILTFETDGLLEITTDTLEFRGRGAFVVLNETRESIQTLRVDRGERLVYTPPPPPEPSGEAVPPTPTSPDDGATTRAPLRTDPAGHAILRTALTQQAEAPDDEAPKIDHYLVVFSDTVRGVSGPRSIDADRLTVWARLIDNKLPDAPFMPADAAPASARSPLEAALLAVVAAQPVDASDPAMDDPAAPADPITTQAVTEASTDPSMQAPQDPVVLTWTGPLTVEPLEDSPAQLDLGDNLALRFEATDGEVDMADADSGATGRALAATYFAQRERIELEGSGGSIVLTSPDAGEIKGMNAVEIELAAGVVTIPTAGELLGREHNLASATPRPQSVAWTESASFAFAVEDGRMTDRLERAAFRGRDRGVRGASEDATILGDTLIARFETPEGAAPQLRRLEVEHALADDGRGGAIGAEAMDVLFDRGTRGEDLDPTRAVLTGDAFARREGRESITAQWIDARLGRDADDNVTVTTAQAREDIAFTDGAGVEGRGATLYADTLAQTATITGPEGLDDRGEPITWVRQQGTRIAGPDIRLDGTARTVMVYGAGVFDHTGTEAEARPIRAAWTGMMTFDDRAGTVACLGGVEAESPGPNGSIDSVVGDRLEITLQPLDPETGEAPEGDRLRFAEVFGSDTTPARVESRSYAPAETDSESDDGDRPIAALYRLESTTIRFAATDDRIVVPAPGRLFVLDHREADEPAPRDDAAEGDDGSPLAGAGGSRGTTLVTWEGSMDFDRAIGRAVCRQDARIANKPLGAERLSEVLADTITAAFSTGDSGDLRWAVAEGDALLRMEDTREILADRLIYNPEARSIQALGENGKRVEITDLLRGTTTNARAVIWDLASDRITLTNPGAIVAPE